MKAALGVFGLAVGAASAGVGIVLLLRGIATRNGRALQLGRRSVYGVLLGATVAVGAMEWALLAHDFSIEYVARNNARATPLLFTVTGLWASLEGSILLWAVILAGYMTFVAIKFRSRANDPLVAWALVVGLLVTLFFFVLMLGPAHPFSLVQGAVPLDGRGPNPLLQNHPLMAIHPPMLYLGYVGFTVPFAFGMAALITGRFGEGWLADIRRTTLIAWVFLTVGIVLGAWWSYEVLGWGGYWAWDPVENASLLPWLTGTAFIHSVMVQERRGLLRVWNLSLVVATFCLTILGTFLTRSGIVNSVHAFSTSALGPWLLTFLGICVAAGLALIAWRGDALRSPGHIDSPVSRESAFLLNNLLFTAFAFVVLLGTVFPLLVEAFQGKQLTVGGPYFDKMATPIGLALLFLMAIAPALPWRATSAQVLRSRVLIPAWVGAAVLVVLVAAGVRGTAQLLAFGLAAFATAAIVREFVVGVRAQRRSAHENVLRATVHALRANPRHYGGLVVHFGVVVLAVALTASASYAVKRDVRLAPGESATVAGVTVTYLGATEKTFAQKNTVRAQVRITVDGRSLGVYAPTLSTFPNSNQAIGTPSVRTGFTRDIYLTLVSSPTEQGRVALGVAVNPLVVWLWIAGGIIVLGTLLALVPSLRRSPLTRRPAEVHDPQTVAV
ncbi:MAG: heme lyase CcmF/NrfE family subunit [Acidimicrobiia bacterium]